MSFPLSFRLCRRLVLCLALAALLATLAAPLHAHPFDRAAPNGPVAGFFDWVQELLVGFGLGAEEDDGEEPTAAFLPESSCHDPDGVPIVCPKTVSVDSPTNPRSEDSDSRKTPLMR